MKNIIKLSTFISLMVLAVLMGACSKNAENEHLPEYCRTYTGFANTASRDFYELLEKQDKGINRSNYLSVISSIELDFEEDDPTKEIDLGGIQCFQNLTSLTLVGRSFKDISEISALSNIQTITLNGTSVVSIDSFKNLSKIKELSISNTKTLQNVEGVEEMTKLTYLDLSDNGIVIIDGLNNLINLETLILRNNEIVKFPSIPSLNLLETLDVSNNKIDELGDSSGLTSLITFDASNNLICDLSTLDELDSLVSLNLSTNDLGCNGGSPEFSSLENSTSLTELYLDHNNLTSISSLAALTNIKDSLTTLHLNDNNLNNIDALDGYENITELNLFNNNLTNIGNLSGMTRLSSIDLSNNTIIDFTPLLSIPNLEAIDLSNNRIFEIPDISEAWPTLSILDLHSNLLLNTTGVEGHPSLEELILYNNGLTQLTGISNLPFLDTLIIFDEEAEALIEPIDRNPNNIRRVVNSYNNLDSLDVTDESGYFEFGFDLANNGEIIDSISGLSGVQRLDFSAMGITIINENSIILENLLLLRADNNKITDISFVLGNPKLRILDVSYNNISNLQIISGVDTDDLDNLVDFMATDISTDNDLLDAFIDLPALESIDLSNTNIVNIDNCFNDLEELGLLLIDGSSIQKIENSFNNIFATFASSNIINLSSGEIGIIDNSFNNGEYQLININGNSTIIPTTYINESFNNITIHEYLGEIGLFDEGLVISGNNFETITDSFNNITTTELSLFNNRIETITGNFEGSTIEFTLNLSTNFIEDIPNLNLLTSVNAINLWDNNLTTVAFLDSIADVTTIDIQEQRLGIGGNPTLNTIDGINNMPTLTTLNYDNIGITAIDGLKNIGITNFVLNADINDFKIITSVSSSSFTGTALTLLDLNNHEITELTFLENFQALTTLSIGINTIDLSEFAIESLETTVVNLTISSKQNIEDFQYLSDFDLVVWFIYSNLNQTEILNFNDLDSLQILNFEQVNNITQITNSFNTMDSLIVLDDYLDSYPNLNNISNSFDLYGTLTHPDTVRIDSAINIIDSFNNVTEVAILSNSGQNTPNFDLDSFDNITNISFENGDYSSYSFLDVYVSLNSVTFETMVAPITDLSNDNIETLSINLLSPTVTSITLDIAQNGSLELATSRFGAFTITMDNTDLTIDAPNTDLTLNHNNPLATYTMDVNDLEINSTNLTTVSLNSLVSQDAVFNTEVLENITRTNLTELNASSLVVNTNVSEFSMSFNANTIQINDNFAVDYTIDVNSGNTTINNTTADLVVDYQGGDLSFVQNTLVSLDILGEFNDLSINSDAFDSLFINGATLNTVDITSNQTNLNVTEFSSEITEITITNDSIFYLNVTIPTDVTLTSSNPGLITLSAQVDNLTLNTANATTITFNPSSSASSLDISNGTNVETLNLNDSTFATTRLDTSKATVDITGTGTATAIDLNGTSISSLTVDHPNATVDFDGAAAILVATLNTNSINMAGVILSTVILTPLSSVDTITIDNNSILNTFTSNDSNISTLIIDSEAANITIDAANALNTTITGDSFITMTVDVGTNPLDINTGKTGTVSFDLIADEVGLVSTLTSIILENTSTINTLFTSSSNLETLTTGTASITDVEIENTSGDLTVTGTNMISLTLNDNITNFVANVGLATVVDFTTTSTSAVTISTQTDDLTINSSGDVTLTSTTLENITATLGTNDISLAITKPALNFTFDGTAGEVDFNTTTLNTLTIGTATNIDTMIINNTNITTLDFTPGSVSNLDFTSSLTTLNITGNDLITAIINDNNLSELTINNTNPVGEVEISTTENSLDLNGSIATVILTDNPLLSLNLNDITISNLTINSNNLNTLNTLTNVTASLEITTNSNNFNLTTQTPSITFNGGTTDNLNLNSTVVDTIAISTTNQELTINAINTTFEVSGANLTTISGLVEEINVTETAATLFTYDITGTTVLFNATEATSLELTGVNSITTLDVASNNLASVLTNNTTITTLNYDSGDNDTIVTTNAVTINHLSTGTASILFNVGVSTQAYNTNSEDITLNTGNLSSTTLNYTDTSTPDIEFTNFDEVTVNLLSTNGVNFGGTIVDLVINGSGLETVTTTTLDISNKYTMNGTLIDNLDFVSTTMLVNVQQIEVNTLSNSNIDGIITKLDGTTIVLTSPIVNQDIYDYFYNDQVTTLTNQETIDTVRYDAFRETAIDNAYNEIMLNTYMDHILEATLRNEIDTQTYRSVEEYFQDFLTDLGQTEVQYGVTESADARAAITATLAQAVLIIEESTLENLVTTSIETDADVYATTEQGNLTFTLA